MILFKPQNVAPIVDGTKTQTRRRWRRRRARPGAVHAAVTRLFGPPFAMLRVVRVWREPLNAISRADARAEGYPSRAAFFTAFERINGSVCPDEPVWCVEFELAEGPEG